MQIIDVPIGKITPYENNPRHNQDAVPLVANSIKEFGFKVPVILDKNNVIVAGHTRIEAAKSLGMKKVPCIYADDLTEEQIKAFRLADNKVSEAAQWDFQMLSFELADIPDIDMSNFGFEIDVDRFESEDDDDGVWTSKKDNENPMRYNAFENQEVMMFDTSDNYYGLPVMQPTQTSGDKFWRFCDWKECPNPSEYIAHFYYDDFKFMSAWREPDKYVERLREFKAVIAPDFSSYTDFPKALQILGAYRRQWCGAYWQYLGLDVIADVQWGNEETWKWCFDGIPKHCTVAVSALGVKCNKEFNGKEDDLFLKGYNQMMERLEPTTILYYGKMIEGCTGNIIRIPSYYEQKFGS